MIQSYVAVNGLILSVYICRSVHSSSSGTTEKKLLFVCVSGSKKKRVAFTPNYCLLWNYTGKKNVAYRPMCVIQRNVVQEQNTLVLSTIHYSVLHKYGRYDSFWKVYQPSWSKSQKPWWFVFEYPSGCCLDALENEGCFPFLVLVTSNRKLYQKINKKYATIL